MMSSFQLFVTSALRQSGLSLQHCCNPICSCIAVAAASVVSLSVFLQPCFFFFERVKVGALWLGCCFHNRFHFRQSLVELAADHFVHVHEKIDRLGHEIVLAGHVPRHDGLISFRLESERRDVSGREGLEKIRV
jgi:hypothetical protein